MSVRKKFYLASLIILVGVVALSLHWPFFWYSLIIILPLFFLGIYDVLQKKRNILRNYPLVGHFRYMLESIRPQIQQYFIQRDIEEVPFSREEWSLIKQRAHRALDELPFGTLRNVQAQGFEWINHSMAPKKLDSNELRISVGGPECKQPYEASRLNISAMSFGALSKNAIRALNRGAKLGNFAHNTGEGGLSPYHLIEGGDLVFQIGTGYFSCRTVDGQFDPVKFKECALKPQVKMIEIKLSQGAKPAHGGILPAVKISEEVSRIRGVPMEEDCISPPAHPAFSTPRGLLEFVAKLRELSEGKPVGFKLCVGIRREFLGICKAMLETGILPDFITVDGAEGGTGAAPMEFTDFVGMPLNDGLNFVHNALLGTGVRHKIRLIASGKIVTGFDMICKMALGADMCNVARPMMFALGCVQSRRCHTNQCPTGVATQDPRRIYALDVDTKAPLVSNYHRATLKSFQDLMGAMGNEKISTLRSVRILRRVSETQILRYSDIYPALEENCLRDNMNIPEPIAQFWAEASAERFELA